MRSIRHPLFTMHGVMPAYEFRRGFCTLVLFIPFGRYCFHRLPFGIRQRQNTSNDECLKSQGSSGQCICHFETGSGRYREPVSYQNRCTRIGSSSRILEQTVEPTACDLYGYGTPFRAGNLRIVRMPTWKCFLLNLCVTLLCWGERSRDVGVLHPVASVEVPHQAHMKRHQQTLLSLVYD